MHGLSKKFFVLALLVSSATYAVEPTTHVTPYFSMRSQSQNLPRLMSDTVDHIYVVDADKHNGDVMFTPEYTRSLYNDDTAKTLFGCYYLQNCNNLSIVGSALIDDDTPKTLMADWFGLSSTYQGSITFQPVIQNVSGDVSFYWGMDKWARGLYLRVHAPIVWTKWDLGAVFQTTDTGSTEAGFTFLTNAETFFCKKGVELAATTTTSAPLNCARFCGCLCGDHQSLTRLSDIQADLGWNFFNRENCHLGLFVRGVAPTGNKVTGEWLFEPIVGNGHHWELGGGLTSSAIIWRDSIESRHIGLYVDANVTHLFNAKQNRVFDLKEKPLSRYMRALNPTTLESTPLANLTSCRVKSSFKIQADVVGMVNYTDKNWSYDLGYNFWATTCEKFDCDSCSDCCSTTTKSCNSCNDACGCCGACIIKNGNSAGWYLEHADDTIHAYGTAAELVLTDSIIDYAGARTRGMSNKIFGHIAYNWNNRELVPYLGLGAEVEFGRNTSCEECFNTCCPDVSCCGSCNTSSNESRCNDECTCCTIVAVSQWGIWLKGGFTF